MLWCNLRFNFQFQFQVNIKYENIFNNLIVQIFVVFTKTFLEKINRTQKFFWLKWPMKRGELQLPQSSDRPVSRPHNIRSATGIAFKRLFFSYLFWTLSSVSVRPEAINLFFVFSFFALSVWRLTRKSLWWKAKRNALPLLYGLCVAGLPAWPACKQWDLFSWSLRLKGDGICCAVARQPCSIRDRFTIACSVSNL